MGGDDSFFLKDRSSLQYFITQVRVLCSLPFALYVILEGGLRLWVGWEEGKEETQGGSIPVYYEACLKTQPAHKTLIIRRGSFPLGGLLFFSINRLTVGSFSINLIQDCKNIA